MNRTNLTALASATMLLTLSGAALAFASGEEGEISDVRSNIENPFVNFTVDDVAIYPGHRTLIVLNPVDRCGDNQRLEGHSKPGGPNIAAMLASFEFATAETSEAESKGGDSSEGSCGGNEGKLHVYSVVTDNRVSGEAEYVYLASIPRDGSTAADWEFRRYMVDRSGSVVTRSGRGVGDRDEAIVTEIERLLAEPRSDSPTAALFPGFALRMCEMIAQNDEKGTLLGDC